MLENIVRRYVHNDYPDAHAAIIGGSAATGGFGEGSDVDVLVFVPRGSGSRRITEKKYGLLFEVFLVALDHYDTFLEQARRSALPTLPRLCAYGFPVKDDGSAADLIAQAKQALLAGPEPVTFSELDRYRYEIAEYAEDFEHSNSRAENFFTLCRLTELLCAFQLRANDRWLGVGKWAFRELTAFDPLLADSLARAVDAYCSADDRTALLAFVERTLQPYGGRIRDGWTEETAE